VSRLSPLELYEAALRGHQRDACAAPAGATAAPGVRVCFDDGSHSPLPVGRYLAGADRLDHSLLDGLQGPVIDVGCGPGRHLHALAAAGVFALGVDISPAAVALARRGGARALVADIFGTVPGAGRWATALLLDGNIGIGGHPERLLARIGELLRPGGVILAEVDPPGRESASRLARIELDGQVSHWFAWARVSATEIGSLAASAELGVDAVWRRDASWFASLSTATSV
jgi:SAM-dependent methyltransferase